MTESQSAPNDPPTCIKCGDEFTVPGGYEVTDYCNPCAQEVASDLLEALVDIAEPMRNIQKEAKASGNRVNGMMANQLCEDANWLRDKARAAIRKAKHEN